MSSVTIRQASPGDWPEIWPIVQETFAGGDTYPYPADIAEDEARHIWLEKPSTTYIALDDNRVAGTYYLKPNQPGRGSHVCNAGFMVSPLCKNKGVGTALCAHALHRAASLGYRAMQFNLVVSTNQPAIHLWEKMGFEIIGVLPGAFHHQQMGFVDAYVMYQSLEQYR